MRHDCVYTIMDWLITPEQLPTLDEFIQRKNAEVEATTNRDQFKELQGTELYDRLLKADGQQRNELKNALLTLVDARINILKDQEPWIPEAVKDILNERDRRWRELYETTQELLTGLKEQARQAESRNISIPEGYSKMKVLANATPLLDHLKKGGKLGFWIFRSQPAREALYIIQKTTVDGQLCNNIQTLEELVKTIRLEQRIEKLWTLWSPFTERIAGSKPMQVGFIEDLCEPLEQILKLYALMGEARNLCSKIKGLPQPQWSDCSEIERYKRTIDAAESEEVLKNINLFFEKPLNIIRTYVAQPEAHRINKDIHEAIEKRDEIAYGTLYSKLCNLLSDRAFVAKKETLHSKLQESLPDLAQQTENDPYLTQWEERLTHFEESWRWAQAKTWLEQYVEGINEGDILNELNDTQQGIKETTRKLAAALAWAHCFKRLKDHEREHLMAWAFEMSKVGKGTGKWAPYHRKAARQNMDQCKGAIPAWIMPLYRVAESVRMDIDTYDVAIIDEASQSGPDALFLLFLAKQIIVVGDDKQISPEDVGIPREDVLLYQERYLKDFPIAHKGPLEAGGSFYDLANILFAGRIILTEHFRCMPEIIHFSNDLCYSHTPLIPLRQYPPKRLEPVVVAQHIPNGYREGDNRTARNIPEAEAIVKKIAECCKKPEYDCPVSEERPEGKKTFGVISLLGEYQARLIERMLLEEIGPEEIARRNIICGDAYAFQGDERDVMFLSMVAAPGETALTALNKDTDMRRFNVATSRARDQLWLFHTPTINDFKNKDCLRFKLLSYCQNPKVKPLIIEGLNVDQLRSNALNKSLRQSKPPKTFDSWFEVDVFLKITDRGHRVIPQYKFGGYSIDLVVEGMKERIAVECDGDEVHSTPEKLMEDEKRQRILERCGWAFWRIRGSEYYYNPDAAMETLWTQLQRLGIETTLKGKSEVIDNLPTSEEPSISETEQGTQETYEAQNENRGTTPERLDAALAWNLTRREERPRFTTHDLQKAIVVVLKNCPNYSCTRDSLTSRVCKHLHFITRGSPRREFGKLLTRALNKLKDASIVEEYKATNVRIRLVRTDYQEALL